jgi:hypothetical protein
MQLLFSHDVVLLVFNFQVLQDRYSFEYNIRQNPLHSHELVGF